MTEDFIRVSFELDEAGLIWLPEIGDEVVERPDGSKVAILVDPQGHTPTQLRENFIWCPNVEQLVQQIEAREGLIYHAGITTSLRYEAVIKTSFGIIEAEAVSLRVAFGKALGSLLGQSPSGALH